MAEVVPMPEHRFEFAAAFDQIRRRRPRPDAPEGRAEVRRTEPPAGDAEAFGFVDAEGRQGELERERLRTRHPSTVALAAHGVAWFSTGAVTA